MIAPAHPSLLMWVGIAALVVWRLVRRFRRLVGRQRLSKVRPWFTVVLFPALLLLLLAASLARPVSAATLAGGVAIGVGLAVFSFRRTVFEVTPAGLYYTPHAHVGIGLSVLFTLRIVYRLVQAGTLSAVYGPTGPASAEAFGSSPLTLAIFGMLAGYYTAYAIGLLRWRAQAEHAPRPPEAT
ncbi:MAG: hypothetical protein JSR59_00010 [Proteobacteria bacterium]|nr:hypothetical protein [Pseudomonadota bacterium]